MDGETVKCSQCGSSFNKMFLMGKQGNANVCPMCGADNMQDEDEHADWIMWYYYGFKNSSSSCLEDRPIDLEKHGDTFYLIKEFQAPPRDASGKSDAAKAELRKYVPDAFAEPKVQPIRCPRCGSAEYTLMNRGYSIFTGFLGSGKVKRVCNRCKREF